MATMTQKIRIRLKAYDHKLLDVSVTEGDHTGARMRLPALPLAMDGRRFGVHQDVARAGEHTREVLAELGYTDERIDALIAQGVVTST